MSINLPIALIVQSIDPNIRINENGYTLLMHCVREDMLNEVKILLERGADPNLHNPADSSPLLITMHHYYNENAYNIFVELLRHGAIIDESIVIKQTFNHQNLIRMKMIIDRFIYARQFSTSRSRVRLPREIVRKLSDFF